MAKLGDVLDQRCESVAADAFGSFVPITVHLDGRISVRKRERAFKGQMFAALPGDVVFSKIDARNGAIGVLPPTVPAAVVTPEFPIFTPKSTAISARYLELVLRAGGFIEALRRRATGTSGRKRITPESFRSLSIPLPPLVEQQALVAAHDLALEEAHALELQATEAEQAGTRTFCEALGVAAPTALPEKPMFVARFRDLERWSHEAVLRGAAGGTAAEAKWPIVRLGDVVADLENGWSPKCHDRPAEKDEWGVLKLGAVSFGVFDEHQNKALPTTLKPQPRLEILPGQVLISRANITRLVGATTFVRETRPKLMLCDKIFRCVFRPDSTIDPEFTATVLRTAGVREQIEARVTGTSPTMKNISKPALLSLTFPLPPLDTQSELVKALAAARAEAAKLREAASQKRKHAATVFEAAIYEELADGEEKQ